MSRIFARGLGAVSPAGWGVAALEAAVSVAEALPTTELARPGWTLPLRVRPVPAPAPQPAFLGHPRLRRSSPIARFAVAAGLEALGAEAERVKAGELRLGIVYCGSTGCVTYSRKFYEEVLREPGTASPLLFPETVFNAPASHLAAVLAASTINYTLVGDSGVFPQALATGAEWLVQGRVDGCLVIAAEELDWLVADALKLFSVGAVLSEGAGAIYLSSVPGSGVIAELQGITEPRLYAGNSAKCAAMRAVREDLRDFSGADWLCDGLQGATRLDAEEAAAWSDWKGRRISPKRACGEAHSAAAAWQCVLACAAVRAQRARRAIVSVAGANEQALGACFGIPEAGGPNP